MKIKRLIIFIVIILIFYTGVIIYAFCYKSEVEVDIIAVNDIAESLAEDWDSLEFSELPCLNYNIDYVVLDNNNHFIKATKNGLNNSINSAISNRDTIIDIKLNNKVLGKLIIFNNTSKIWQQYRNYLLIISVFIMIFVSIFCVTFLIYIDRSIFKPFRKLQDFASHVAKGNLDIPLEMDKSNMFGAFTESFDLMREELN
ncbi:MAG: hypothetical protein K0S55_1935, partial [Clostridia bacterium]|nr:hypothetical protein [Clostridia bacterium]